MKTRLLIFLLFLTIYIYPQQYVAENGILKDSSYTVYGYYQKELKKFPFIRIVETELDTSITAKYDITYKIIGERALHLDLFYPNKKINPLPIIIFIHGGGWRSGVKSFQHPLAMKIASLGYLCATIEYRLSPEAIYPAAVYDIKSAIKWLKVNAKNYSADSSKVVLSGCSSGGHLAALCGVTSNQIMFEEEDSILKASSRVAAVIDIDGILDFTDPAESGKDTNVAYPSVGKLWLGQSYSENPELWIEASPLTYVDKNSPMFLFINSSIPRFHAGRDQAEKILKSNHVFYSEYTLEHTPHTFWLFKPWFDPTVKYIVDFLSKIF